MSDANAKTLPKGWTMARLGDVLRVVRGVSYRKGESRKSPSEGLVPVLRANNIQENLTFDDLVYVPAKYVSGEQMLRQGDIVVAASSGSRAIVGKAAQLREAWTGAFGTFCFALRPEPLIESRFLGWFLHTNEYRNRVSNLSAGVNINNLRAEHVEETPLRLPPFAEQQSIADALDELLSDLDSGVALLEGVREKLKHYRASVLKAAVEGSLITEWRQQHPDTEPASELLKRILAERRRRWEEDQLRKFAEAGREPPKNWREKYKEPVEPDVTDVPGHPEYWVVASMDQLTSHITSGSRDWTRYYGRGSGTFIMAQNVRPGRLDLETRQAVDPPPNDSNRERSRVENGDLLITIVGANTGDVCDVPKPLPEHYVCQSVALMRPVEVSISEYLTAYCISPAGAQLHYQRYIYGAGRPHLSFDQLKMTPVLLPPLAEQEAIAEAVEDQLSVIEHISSDIESKIQSAQALRQSILRHAFTGQLVPQVPNDEPASELLKRIAVEREERGRQTAAARRTAAKQSRPRKRASAAS